MGRFYHVFLAPPTLAPFSELKNGNCPELEPYSIPIHKPAKRSAPEESPPTAPMDQLLEINEVAPSSDIGDDFLPHSQPSQDRSSLDNSAAGPSSSLRKSKRQRTQPRGSTSQPLRETQSSHSRRESRRLKKMDSELNTTAFDQSESFLSSLDSQESQADVANMTAEQLFPEFEIDLGALLTLPEALEQGATYESQTSPEEKKRRNKKWDDRFAVLCCVMDVHQPVQRKGIWMAKWKVCGPGRHQETVSCEVLFWGSCAKQTEGLARRGDVVFLTDAKFVPDSANDPAHLKVAGTKNYDLKPPVVAFRTLPRYSAKVGDYVYRPGPRGAEEEGQRGPMLLEDRNLRPNLDLGRSDPRIRRVREMVEWCTDWFGGEKLSRKGESSV